jgi:hypothetical protein
MTKDEALKLALEAGFRVGPSREGPDDVWGVGANLERFAKLVAAKERAACAEICKKHADVYAGLEQNPTTKSAWAACIDNLDSIRARGQA